MASNGHQPGQRGNGGESAGGSGNTSSQKSRPNVFLTKSQKKSQHQRRNKGFENGSKGSSAAERMKANYDKSRSPGKNASSSSKDKGSSSNPRPTPIAPLPQRPDWTGSSGEISPHLREQAARSQVTDSQDTHRNTPTVAGAAGTSAANESATLRSISKYLVEAAWETMTIPKPPPRMSPLPADEQARVDAYLESLKEETAAKLAKVDKLNGLVADQLHDYFANAYAAQTSIRELESALKLREAEIIRIQGQLDAQVQHNSAFEERLLALERGRPNSSHGVPVPSSQPTSAVDVSQFVSKSEFAQQSRRNEIAFDSLDERTILLLEHINFRFGNDLDHHLVKGKLEDLTASRAITEAVRVHMPVDSNLATLHARVDNAEYRMAEMSEHLLPMEATLARIPPLENRFASIEAQHNKTQRDQSAQVKAQQQGLSKNAEEIAAIRKDVEGMPDVAQRLINTVLEATVKHIEAGMQERFTHSFDTRSAVLQEQVHANTKTLKEQVENLRLEVQRSLQSTRDPASREASQAPGAESVPPLGSSVATQQGRVEVVSAIGALEASHQLAELTNKVDLMQQQLNTAFEQLDSKTMALKEGVEKLVAETRQDRSVAELEASVESLRQASDKLLQAGSLSDEKLESLQRELNQAVADLRKVENSNSSITSKLDTTREQLVGIGVDGEENSRKIGIVTKELAQVGQHLRNFEITFQSAELPTKVESLQKSVDSHSTAIEALRSLEEKAGQLKTELDSCLAEVHKATNEKPTVQQGMQIEALQQLVKRHSVAIADHQRYAQERGAFDDGIDRALVKLNADLRAELKALADDTDNVMNTLRTDLMTKLKERGSEVQLDVKHQLDAMRPDLAAAKHGVERLSQVVAAQLYPIINGWNAVTQDVIAGKSRLSTMENTLSTMKPSAEHERIYKQVVNQIDTLARTVLVKIQQKLAELEHDLSNLRQRQSLDHRDQAANLAKVKASTSALVEKYNVVLKYLRNRMPQIEAASTQVKTPERTRSVSEANAVASQSNSDRPASAPPNPNAEPAISDGSTSALEAVVPDLPSLPTTSLAPSVDSVDPQRPEP